MNIRKSFGILAGVTATGIAVAVCYEQHRRRQIAHALAAMPGAKNILPYLDANSRMLLASFGKAVPPVTVSAVANRQ